MLVVGDFVQVLSTVNQKGVFVKANKRAYRSFNGCLWEKFQLHEVVEIIGQSTEPNFTQ